MLLRRHSPHIIKVCGVTTEEDVLAASDSGATAIGLNFYPRSPRYITMKTAANISGSTSPQVQRVGVFVKPSVDELRRAIEQVPLDIVQIHGGLPDDLPSSLRVWKAVTVHAAFSAGALNANGIEAFLLDAPAADYGGSGNTFEWQQVAAVKALFLLAGGLDASNVAEAIAAVKPWGVDACSRLESAPGKKDLQKVRDFVKAAQIAFAMLDEAAELVR